MIYRFIFLFFFQTTFAQMEEEFIPIKKDSSRGLKIYESIEPTVDKIWDEYNGIYNKEFKSFKKPFKNELKHNYSRILFSPEYEIYLKQILSELVSNSPELQKEDFRIYFLRNPSYNAITCMDGSIFIYVGLLEILESEAQLAMIIGHELAHWQEKHSQKDFEELNNMLASEEIQSLLRDAKKKGNMRYDRLMKLSKVIEFGDAQHSRLHESESDSISLNYLMNTKYDLNDAIIGIHNLKMADTELFNMNDILLKTFHFDEFPFNNKWTYKKQSMSDRMKFELTEKEKDSLQTHPYPEQRYKKLKNRLSSLTNPIGKKNIVSEERFYKMKKDFKYQSIYILMASNKISLAIYRILILQNNGDSSLFLKESLYRCLGIISEKLSNHTLNHYVDNRNPYFSPEYNKLIIFIDNLSISEIDKIRENYKIKHQIKI